MLILIDSKNVWQNSTLTHDKNSHKLGRQRTYIKIIKAIYVESTVNFILTSETLKAFPLSSGIRQECTLLPLPFKVISEVLATKIKEEREIKFIQIGKQVVKLSLLVDNV